MRCFIARCAVAVAAVLTPASILCAQQPADTAQQQPAGGFYWINFHNPKDQDIVVWVTRSLAVDEWSAIREIGVKYDAALVVTTDRKTPQSLPEDDTFSVWSASLTSHAVTLLLGGVNLRIFDWQHFADGFDDDLIAFYDDCRSCAATTYFTAFHYDGAQHAWAARWLRGGKGVPVWNANPPSGVDMSQLYALMAEGDGHASLYIWSHIDYGKQKPPQDYIFRFDRDPFNGADRTAELSGKELDDMKLRICRGQDVIEGFTRGQDTEVCEQLVPRAERHPVTTPPANNHGRIGSSASKPSATTPKPNATAPKTNSTSPNQGQPTQK